MFNKHKTILLSAMVISAAVLFAAFFAFNSVQQALAQASNKSGNATSAGGNATAAGNTTTQSTTGASNPVPSASNSARGY